MFNDFILTIGRGRHRRAVCLWALPGNWRNTSTRNIFSMLFRFKITTIRQHGSKMNGKQQRHPLCGLDGKFSYSNLIAIGILTIDLSELDEMSTIFFVS